MRERNRVHDNVCHKQDVQVMEDVLLSFATHASTHILS